VPAKAGSVLDGQAARTPIALPYLRNSGACSHAERKRGGKHQPDSSYCPIHDSSLNKAGSPNTIRRTGFIMDTAPRYRVDKYQT
jgi:hypothetical protein